MEIPHPESLLARWGLNLRGGFSYTISFTCPDLMSYNVKDWTDMQCIETLANFQRRHKLWEGTIPADAFAVAITHFTARALDEGQRSASPWKKVRNKFPKHTKTLNHGDRGQGC